MEQIMVTGLMWPDKFVCKKRRLYIVFRRGVLSKYISTCVSSILPYYSPDMPAWTPYFGLPLGPFKAV